MILARGRYNFLVEGFSTEEGYRFRVVVGIVDKWGSLLAACTPEPREKVFSNREAAEAWGETRCTKLGKGIITDDDPTAYGDDRNGDDIYGG